ncbi:MAG: CAP domain-containing protein, partial [Candidatus Curtissbacteria bacterium]|nr:CAP domain-containing protein [Candidatus Curtissbacteria bacterium]
MIARRIHHHFFPHFVVDAQSALAISEPHRVHHKAHALSATSLFIYLQVLIIVGAGLFVIRTTAPQILGTITFSADQIISLTNQKRAENGLSALSYNGQLAQAASAKASDMLANNYWAHTSPSGRTPWSFITAAGYKYVYAGENLARDFDDAGSVVNAWMNS